MVQKSYRLEAKRGQLLGLREKNEKRKKDEMYGDGGWKMVSRVVPALFFKFYCGTKLYMRIEYGIPLLSFFKL